MVRRIDYNDSIIDRILYSKISLVLFLASNLGVFGSVAGLSVYSMTRNPNPPVYRDVNADGVTDKVIQHKVRGQIFVLPYYTIEEEVRYGMEINGKTLFLPEEVFEKR